VSGNSASDDSTSGFSLVLQLPDLQTICIGLQVQRLDITLSVAMTNVIVNLVRNPLGPTFPEDDKVSDFFRGFKACAIELEL
jgi:hypothetical protein